MKKQIMRIVWSGQTGPFERSRRASVRPSLLGAVWHWLHRGSKDRRRTAQHTESALVGALIMYETTVENSLNVNNRRVQ